MADLQVDAGSLSAAASSGDTVAAELVTDAAVGVSGDQPSEMGVSAFDAALSAVQTHQSERVSENAGQLHGASAVYTTADGDGADHISRTV